MHNQPLYFTSPKQAVEVVIDMIIAEEFEKLSRYYDLSGSDIDRDELTSGRLFVRTERPEVSHPGEFWRIKEPFPSGFQYSGHSTNDEGIATVRVSVEIDQGGGMFQRGKDSFRMKQQPEGWQLLPRAAQATEAEAQTAVPFTVPVEFVK